MSVVAAFKMQQQRQIKIETTRDYVGTGLVPVQIEKDSHKGCPYRIFFVKHKSL